MPDIEVINNEQIKEAGYRYKEQIIKLRGQMDKTGTYEGDRNLVEAEQDPDIMLEVQSSRQGSLDSEDEKNYIETKAKKIGDIINQVRKNHERQERMFHDFEKNLGLKIKALIEYDDDKDQALNDPMVDLLIFDKVFKNTYNKIKEQHKGVVDKLRTKEFSTFEKLRSENRKYYTEHEVRPHERID